MASGGNSVAVLAPILPGVSALPDPKALTLALPDTTTYPEWIGLGRELADQKRHLNWLIGDWIVFGRQRFPEQIELALESISDEPRQFKRIEKTARVFPPHLRDKTLSFDHHAHVADLPKEDALPLLKEARAEHLSARTLRIRAMLRKVETGQILPRDASAEDDALVALCRAWNRAPHRVREEFADMVAESAYGVIDP